MKKYFNTTDARDTDNADIFMFMHNADKHPEDFIRIAINEDHMRMNYRGRQEYDIDRAVIFLRDSEIALRFDYDFEETDGFFYAALDAEKNGIAFRLDDSVKTIESFETFSPNKGIFALFMTEEGTIFLTYDGTCDRIGYGFLPETEDGPRVLEQMDMLFELFQPYIDAMEEKLREKPEDDNE